MPGRSLLHEGINTSFNGSTARTVIAPRPCSPPRVWVRLQPQARSAEWPLVLEHLNHLVQEIQVGHFSIRKIRIKRILVNKVGSLTALRICSSKKPSTVTYATTQIEICLKSGLKKGCGW